MDSARLMYAWALVLAAAVLAWWPVPVSAYGQAGGATHTADCYSAAASTMPSYGGCATDVYSIRQGDMQKTLADLKAATPSYNFIFQAWNVCEATFTGQSATCTFYFTKIQVSSGAESKGNNAGINYKHSTQQTVDCVGAGFQKLGNNSCVCAPGYAPDGHGGCSPHECPEPGIIAGTETKKFVYTGMASGGLQVCFDGCLISGNFGAGEDGNWYVLGPFANTGQKCNPSNQGGTYPPAGGPDSGGQPPVEDTSKCSPGQCPGTVNGTQVCVACDVTSSGQYHGNGNGGKWTQTDCSNGTCVTKGGDIDQNGNAKPPDEWDVGSGGDNPQANPGGSSGNCTGSNCQSQDKFCEENPDSILCKTSTWGGTCAGNFACTGDAVQCAIAEEQHKRNCVLFDTETDMSQKGRDAANGLAQPDGHPGNSAVTTPIDFASKIDTTNSLSGSCPAGRTVSLMGQTIVLLTGDQCDALAMVGQVLVGLCALACVGIVFR